MLLANFFVRTHTQREERREGGEFWGAEGGMWVRNVAVSVLKERRQSASTSEEKEHLSGSGIPIASSRLFYLFLSLVPSFFSLAGTSGLPLVPGTPKGNSGLIPNGGWLVQEILFALTWMSLSRGCQIPAFQGVGIVFQPF